MCLDTVQQIELQFEIDEWDKTVQLDIAELSFKIYTKSDNDIFKAWDTEKCRFVQIHVNRIEVFGPGGYVLGWRS